MGTHFWLGLVRQRGESIWKTDSARCLRIRSGFLQTNSENRPTWNRFSRKLIQSRVQSRSKAKGPTLNRFRHKIGRFQTESLCSFLFLVDYTASTQILSAVRYITCRRRAWFSNGSNESAIAVQLVRMFGAGCFGKSKYQVQVIIGWHIYLVYVGTDNSSPCHQVRHWESGAMHKV